MADEKPSPCIRQARMADMAAIAGIYERIHDQEEAGNLHTGWKRGIYPVAETARAAIEAGEMFVLEEMGAIRGSAIINRRQLPGYGAGQWRYPAKDDEVMVLHTLAIDPDFFARGYGHALLSFYASYALERKCPYLRMDTNAINMEARNFYKKLGFEERGIIPADFNGIPGARLVLLEILSRKLG